jgi:hypothetical protein
MATYSSVPCPNKPLFFLKELCTNYQPSRMFLKILLLVHKSLQIANRYKSQIRYKSANRYKSLQIATNRYKSLKIAKNRYKSANRYNLLQIATNRENYPEVAINHYKSHKNH